MSENRNVENQNDQALTKDYMLRFMQNIEGKMSKAKRKRTMNWPLVQDYMLGFTSKGGSTSCCIQCIWMGVDPDGYTFFNNIE